MPHACSIEAPARFWRFLQAAGCLLLAACLVLGPARPCHGAGAQTGLTFREDTVDLLRFLREGHGRAQDDHLTFSLAAWHAWGPPQRSLELGLALHCLTDRLSGTRTDLGFVQLEKSLWHSQSLAWIMGLGLAARGDLGGQSLQNGYHGLSGNALLDLEYPTHRHWGGLFTQRLDWIALKGAGSRAGILAAHCESGAGFHRASLLAHGDWMPATRWRLEAGAGVVRHHHLASELQHAFQSGPMGALLGHWSPASRLELSIFVLVRNTRQDQSVPGVSLTWGRNALASRGLPRLLQL